MDHGGWYDRKAICMLEFVWMDHGGWYDKKVVGILEFMCWLISRFKLITTSQQFFNTLGSNQSRGSRP